MRLFEYDGLDRLAGVSDYKRIALTNVSAIGPPKSEAGFKAANIQSKIDSLTSSLKATVTSSSGLQLRKFDYNLDSNSNRVQTHEVLTPGGVDNTTLYKPDSNDRYEYVGSKRIVYDKMWNMLNDGVNSYRYDAFNNLAEIKTSSGLIQLFRNAIYKVTSSKSKEGIYEFTFAGYNLLEWRKNGDLEAQLVPLEHPYQYCHLACNKMDSAPIFNVIDSLVGWVSLSDGSVYVDCFYDPFGQILARSSKWPAPFGFAGYLHDEQANVYLLPRRDYHPLFGRFLQVDPAGLIDGTNLYAYARHSPGTLLDFSGLHSSTHGMDWNSGKKPSNDFSEVVVGGIGRIGEIAWSGIKTALTPMPIRIYSNVIQVKELGSKMYEAFKNDGRLVEGTISALNQVNMAINPTFHMLMATDNARNAIDRGDPRKAGELYVDAILGAIGTVGMAMGGAKLTVNALGAGEGASFGAIPETAVPKNTPLLASQVYTKSKVITTICREFICGEDAHL